ncbi:hypothetical protein [Ornithinimicrobium kibberense]|uniref:hypothetical protein n=1 Tax=Ornithinimicrobium kibberense TaxID=282060 RepID=UPI003609DCD0
MAEQGGQALPDHERQHEGDRQQQHAQPGIAHVVVTSVLTDGTGGDGRHTAPPCATRTQDPRSLPSSCSRPECRTTSPLCAVGHVGRWGVAGWGP